jgi:diaminohydroxyphosphoribosylaminopyrimidine deaminase/5-amino-6-(5-phosphoribosylamino)uracil reductase
MVGAVLVQSGRIIARGWHRQAGQPHAEIEAMRNAIAQGHSLKGATLYVTLEPCSTVGRTPPCTEAIIASGITDVVCGVTDPNPKHAGRGFELLRAAGIGVIEGVRTGQCERLNEAFNHWIVRGTPFVTVKAAMSLDGKLATASGQSKWITGLPARAFGMKLRRGSDAILVGVNTVIKDNPKLTLRGRHGRSGRPLRRFVLDSHARTPLTSELLNGPMASGTTCIVSGEASPESVSRLAARANVWVAPLLNGRIDLAWVLARLGRDGVVSLLVEGGGEVNASFLLGGHAQRIAFFYAPIILGGRQSTTAVGGTGAGTLDEALSLNEVAWRKLGQDLLLTARLQPPHAGPNCC